MKKTVAALLAAALLALPCLPGSTFADTGAEADTGTEIVRAEGKLVKGRTFMPLRVVSEGLGAEVGWDQKTKTVTLHKGDIEVILPVNSNTATVNGADIRTDAIPQVERGRTYVPLRFISQSIGASIAWDQASGVATLMLDDRQVVVSTVVNAKFPAIAQARIDALVRKANEATDLSAYDQIRAHFKTYFTDTYINALIRQKELKSSHRFTVKPFTYFYDGEGHGYLTQIESPDGAGGMDVERMIMLRYVGDQWMVEDIVFSYLNP